MSRDRAMKRIQAILREMEEHERGKTLRAAALVHEINRQA
jgi:hypothetical protein